MSKLKIEIRDVKKISKKIDLFKKLVEFDEETQVLNASIVGKVILKDRGVMFLNGEIIEKRGSKFVVEMYKDDIIVDFKNYSTLTLTIYNK